MGTTIPPVEKGSGEKATFGSCLGKDFQPLGRRIIVPKARDAKPLKVKLTLTNKEADS
ncbi:hypothetical protein [Rhizobium sp. Rhizsp42]|uniref:hypothetical protein n=1 Tax=Rhizobium sp. Rhizsp42 TaxID=3243034 RepID=UPI0039B096B4